MEDLHWVDPSTLELARSVQLVLTGNIVGNDADRIGCREQSAKNPECVLEVSILE